MYRFQQGIRLSLSIVTGKNLIQINISLNKLDKPLKCGEFEDFEQNITF